MASLTNVYISVLAIWLLQLLLLTIEGNHVITVLSDTCCIKAQLLEQNFKHRRTFVMGLNNACHTFVGS